ncbi:MAG: AI-2E family transporter [Actinomycetales bacterium]|nr:AI-2E family transporter [Candidatus Lutibacillus vidarii]
MPPPPEQSDHLLTPDQTERSAPADRRRSRGPAVSDSGHRVRPAGSLGGNGSTGSNGSMGSGGRNRLPIVPAGLPLDRQSPFYVGFLGALGVLVAMGLVRALQQLDTVLTLLLVSLFLTLALNPVVEALIRRGFTRGWSVAAVFGGLIVVFALLGSFVIPPVAQQGGDLVQRAPTYLTNFVNQSWVQDIDQHYQVLARAQQEINAKLTDGTFVSQVFGGVLDAGKALASGIFSTLTVLILVLYFLATLPVLKGAIYALVPATRRPRVVSLSEEVMRRVGSYAIGQVAVASVNAFFSWLMMLVVGIPYAAVLAVAVGFLGLVPMVGATLGAVVVGIVALFDEPKKAVIAIIYYIVYQQLENYAVMPRIMQRTVSVPGAVTVVAAMTGGALMGMLGALIAIPAAAGLLLIYEEVIVPRQDQY